MAGPAGGGRPDWGWKAWPGVEGLAGGGRPAGLGRGPDPQHQGAVDQPFTLPPADDSGIHSIRVLWIGGQPRPVRLPPVSPPMNLPSRTLASPISCCRSGLEVPDRSPRNSATSRPGPPYVVYCAARILRGPGRVAAGPVGHRVLLQRELWEELVEDDARAVLIGGPGLRRVASTTGSYTTPRMPLTVNTCPQFSAEVPAPPYEGSPWCL